ncbi:hypothetical protein BH24ACT5_BH24ACT5_16710 [soil metagenome]
MSAADAARLGLAEGDAVVVASAQGPLQGEVSASTEPRAGAVSVPHGYGAPNVTAPTRATVDPHTGVVRQGGVPVTVIAAGRQPSRFADRDGFASDPVNPVAQRGGVDPE